MLTLNIGESIKGCEASYPAIGNNDAILAEELFSKDETMHIVHLPPLLRSLQNR
jgi:hypothetical protein